MITVSATNRVVFITQRFPPDKGGNAARMHDITTNLSEWDVTVLSPPPSYPPGEFERSKKRKQTETVKDVTVHRLWTWQPTVENPSMSRRLAYYLTFGIHAMLWLLFNVRKYDVVVTSTPPISTGAPGLLGKALGKPWVVDVRDLWIDASISLDYLEAGSLIERISRRFQRRVLHSADRIAVTTETLGQKLTESYGEALADKLVHIPNGVDIEQFQPCQEQQTRMEVTANGGSTVESIPNGGKFTIIYTGNLGSSQDLESCIHAMEFVSTDATLRLVGSGDVESELKRLVTELEVDDRVTFDGLRPRSEIPSLLNRATIGIAPLKSSDELEYAMPTKVYEYMGSGLPVLVTGRGEIERVIEDAECGVHVDNDPKQIAAAIDELLADERKLQQFSTNGREYVESNYDRKVIAAKLSDELTELVRADSDG